MSAPSSTPPDWAHYKRKGLSEMRPYHAGEDISHVSISEPDRQAGSPKEGDMIARNPKNHADQWLVAKKYFEDNLEPAAPPDATAAPSTEENGNRIAANAALLRLFQGEYRNPGDRHSDALFAKEYVSTLETELAAKEETITGLRGLDRQNESIIATKEAEIARLEAICVDHYAAHSAASHEMARFGLSGDVRPGKMLHDALARAERAEAQLRARTQWQCACGGTDCAGQAENERLRAELGPLREIVGVRCDAESTPSDITNWMNLVSHADAAKKLRARVAELENDLEKSKHEADDWHRAWETVTEQAKKEVAELEQALSASATKAAAEYGERLKPLFAKVRELERQLAEAVVDKARKTEPSTEDVIRKQRYALRRCQADIDAARAGKCTS